MQFSINEYAKKGLFNESCGIYTKLACNLTSLHSEKNQVMAAIVYRTGIVLLAISFHNFC